MEDIGADEGGDVRAVVDREELPVRASRTSEDLQCCEFIGGADRLVAQLDDVDAAGVRGVEEALQISGAGASIRAQVEAISGDARGPGLRALPSRGVCMMAHDPRV